MAPALARPLARPKVPDTMTDPSPSESSTPAADATPPSHSQRPTPSLRVVTAEREPPRVLGEKLEPTEEMLAELAAASQRLETATPEEIIAWAWDTYGERLTMATAFGAEGCTILEMISRVAPGIHVFNLETGYQFQETLDLRDRIAEKYGVEVELVRPELTVEQYEQKHGGPLYRSNPTQCCLDRKIRQLYTATEGRHAWMSAIRRDQSDDRASAPIVGWDKKFQLVKISPLANWTKQDVWKRITERDIPYNPLYDQGYTSIGCFPCTRAVTFGEDERAGRWSGFEKTECGLHSLEDD